MTDPGLLPVARTVGVEEELMLFDAYRPQAAPLGEQMVDAADRAAARDREAPALLEHELKREQTEIGSPPLLLAEDLRAELIQRRAHAARFAAARGGRVAATGTSPVKTRPSATHDERYLRMTAEFGLIARQQLTCGQHVHVAVSSPEEGVAVLDRIRLDLATVLAVSANSPFFQDQDSGYASYRTVLWGTWPSAGPVSVFGSVTGYRQAVADLLASGAALDDGMIYFDARLSARYPTVEIRVADVCTDVEDTVLVALLCRALVETAARDWRDGAPVVDRRVELLRAAAWRAARFGLAGELMDVRTVRTAPAWSVLDGLLVRLLPALTDAGDLRRVTDGLARLRQRGTGAERQRAVASSGGPSALVDDLVARTVLG